MLNLLYSNSTYIIILLLVIWIIILLRDNLNLRVLLKNEKELKKEQIALEEKFKSISNEVLIRSHNNFLNIAKETFDKILNIEKNEQNKKQTEFLHILQPIHETLVLFDKKISQIEKERIDAYSDLRRQVKDLMQYQQEIQKETSNLNKALSSPFMSGQWGEMQLKRVVEISGMLAHCDFFEQEKSEFSRLRPDMVIRLPGDRNIIVDAKAPLDAYINAINTGDESYLEHHARIIKNHIKILGQKAYWEQFSPTPEFVLMFLPGESFFSSAIKKDPTLIEYGVREKVIITTPITLIALLKAIAFSWQQEALTKNAKQIGEVGRLVFANLEKLVENSKSFENRMRKNIEEYEKINSFIDKNIIPSVTKLKKLGIEIDEQAILQHEKT
ncbi:MAG: DNA recombination protein RmuC [Holosporales bacterium]|nr:DNA recombination protein RmuC [Holosporales bacterium]